MLIMGNIKFTLIMVILSLLMIFSSNSKASNVDCLARIIYAESRGTSIEAAAINAKAAINRSRDTCKLIKHKLVKAVKKLPKQVEPYFISLAKTAFETEHDISNGANAWNTGTKPKNPGDITKVAGGQVFYTMKVSKESAIH